MLHRPHVYSDWWYGLQHLGLTRHQNFFVGGAWVVAFFLSAFVLLRVRRWSEVFISLAVLASPPVLLGMYRANNDLVIFALLAVAVLLLARPGKISQLGAVLLIALATGLKFYPAVAVVAVLLLRPWPRLRTVALAGGAVLALVVIDVAPQASRGMLRMKLDVHKFGEMIWLRQLQLEGPVVQAAGALAILAAGFACARLGWTRGLAAENGAPRDRLAFAIGAAVLVACFVTGISFGYRLIFLLLLLPWLLRGGGFSATGGAPRWVVRLAIALILITAWADGLFCLLFNVVLVPVTPEMVENWSARWREIIQPLVWLLMVFLAGWLWDMALAAWRDRRGEARVAAGSA